MERVIVVALICGSLRQFAVICASCSEFFICSARVDGLSLSGGHLPDSMIFRLGRQPVAGTVPPLFIYTTTADKCNNKNRTGLMAALCFMQHAFQCVTMSVWKTPQTTRATNARLPAHKRLALVAAECGNTT